MLRTSTDTVNSSACIDRYRFPVGLVEDPVLYLFFRHTAVGLPPKIGLTTASVYQAFYVSPQTAHPLPMVLVPGPAENGRCGFWEIDRQTMPGLYGFQVPAFLRGQGLTHITFNFAGARRHYLELFGVDYDPYDAFALGLETWVRSNCHEHLTSGLRQSMPLTLRPLLEDWLIN